MQERNVPPEVFKIRPMRAEDVSALVAIDGVSNETHWSAADFEREFSLPISSAWVAERSGKLAGFAVMWIVAGIAQILQWAVAPEERRKGIGSALMQKLLVEARRSGCGRIELEYREGNGAAERLYQKFGFQKSGLRKEFYPSNPVQNAVLMEKIL